MTEPDQTEYGFRTPGIQSTSPNFGRRRSWSNPLSRTLFFIAVGMSLANRARAGDAADLRGLLEETVVTTASKTKETGSSAPATSTTLTADDMRRYGIRTVDEAISFLSLGAASYNPFYTPEVSVRGVGIEADQGDHVLLLVDGHSMNDSLYGSARFGRGIGLPMELIDHIEVILGPGSVLYGSSAMLGVVNVVTKRAKDYSGAHIAVESEIPLSYRVAAGVGSTFELFGSPGEVVLGMEYYQKDGPNLKFDQQNIGLNYTGMLWRLNHDSGNDGIWGGTTKHTPYERAPSAYLSARLGDFRLRVQASTFKVASPLRGRKILDVALFDDPDSYMMDRAIRGDLTWERALSELFTLSARGYVDSFDNRTFVNPSDFIYCRRKGVTDCQWAQLGVTRWGGAELQGSFNWSGDGRLVSLLGVDGRYRYVQGRYEVSNLNTGTPLFTLFNPYKREGGVLGPYVQTTWQPVAAFGVNAGARLDYDPRFDPVISPRVAVTTKPWSDGTVKAVFSEAFRAPSFIESETRGPILLPAGNLSPETVRSIEGSVEQRFGSQRIVFGAFRSWWSNMIENHVLTAEEKTAEVAKGNLDFGVSAGRVEQYRNAGTIANYGFNGTYEGTAAEGRLRYAANLTGAIARRETGGTDRQLTLAPRFFGNVRMSYDLLGDWPVLALATHFLGSRIADRAWDGGWATLPISPPQAELRGTISGYVPGIKGLSYRFSANYILGDQGPYVVGFTQGGNTSAFTDTAQLVPVDKFRTAVDLHYDLFQ